MKFRRLVTLVMISSIWVWCCSVSSEQDLAAGKIRVKPGAEVFLEKHIGLVKNKRVGLITNPTGVDSSLNSLIELLFSHPDIDLIALYSPEHGVRGNAQAGEYIPFYIDDKYKLPVFSLYGQSHKPEPGMLSNIDEYMRSFDTEDAGKTPEDSMVAGIDVMLFDIQDVGTRIYTYIATMAYCMQACAEAGIDFIVLDRPNPLNGLAMEGPVLEYPHFSSFVGLYPIPVRHGMTAGELANYFNENFLEKKANLTVIPIQGWIRDMWYDETLLPWVFPSPNMPSLDTATVYPGQVFLEGTNVSEGRGTTRPFELFGAPWIDGFKLTDRLNSFKLDGVIFREAWFTPVFSKFKGKLCGGAQIHVLDRDKFKPWETTLYIIQTIKELYPDDLKFHRDYFDMIMGTDKVRNALEQGVKVPQIIKQFREDIEDFAEIRKPYLIY